MKIQQAIEKLESSNNPGATVKVTNVSDYSADVKISKGSQGIYEGRQHYPKEVIDGIVKKYLSK